MSTIISKKIGVLKRTKSKTSVILEGSFTKRSPFHSPTKRPQPSQVRDTLKSSPYSPTHSPTTPKKKKHRPSKSRIKKKKNGSSILGKSASKITNLYHSNGKFGSLRRNRDSCTPRGISKSTKVRLLRKNSTPDFQIHKKDIISADYPKVKPKPLKTKKNKHSKQKKPRHISKQTSDNTPFCWPIGVTLGKDVDDGAKIIPIERVNQKEYKKMQTRLVEEEEKSLMKDLDKLKPKDLLAQRRLTRKQLGLQPQTVSLAEGRKKVEKLLELMYEAQREEKSMHSLKDMIRYRFYVLSEWDQVDKDDDIYDFGESDFTFSENDSDSEFGDFEIKKNIKETKDKGIKSRLTMSDAGAESGEYDRNKGSGHTGSPMSSIKRDTPSCVLQRASLVTSPRPTRKYKNNR